MQNIVILGSTGSLGTQTIEVLEKFRDHFKVIGLAAYKSEKLLQEQSKKLNCQNYLVSRDGADKLVELATLPEANVIVNVLSGIHGTEATKTALKAGKVVLLGNKESLIADGKEIMSLARKGQIIPLDSEHNAIFEILKKHSSKAVRNIILPCSGGPFLGKTLKDLAGTTVEETLKHPKWNMGAKISVESATLLNKGLEVIEAHYLFNTPLEQIKVAVHPECIIHGMVEFEDETIAYLSKPDMKEHIENAILHLLNQPTNREIRPLQQNEFQLQEPDHQNFPGIQIILTQFQKAPEKMAQFLDREHHTINKFLNKEITIPQLYQELRPLL